MALDSGSRYYGHVPRMAVDDWNYKHPVELQDVPWDCAAASLAWALQAHGVAITESEVVAGLGPHRINPTYGLLDASGAGLVSYLAEIGVSAKNNAEATWGDVLAAAGHQPMVMGGRHWCHWTGVRMGPWALGYDDAEWLWLANPAPGWMGVQQWMDWTMFDGLGDFSAVWFPA